MKRIEYYTETTTRRPCELCGARVACTEGYTIHEYGCVRKSYGSAPVQFKYGFRVGQIAATNSRVAMEMDLRDRAKEFPEGTLLEITAISAKVCDTSKRYIQGNPRRFDDRTFFYNAVLADGSDPTPIRECFASIRKLTREEQGKYRRELSERINNNLAQGKKQFASMEELINA